MNPWLRICNIEDGGAPTGGSGGAPAPAPAPTPEPALTPEQITTLQTENAQFKAKIEKDATTLEAAQGLDRKLAIIRDTDPKAWAFMHTKLSGGAAVVPATVPELSPADDAADDDAPGDDVPESVRRRMTDLQTENTALREAHERTAAQVAAIQQGQAERELDAEIIALNAELGADVVQALMPAALAQAEKLGVAAQPGALTTIVKGLDHGDVAQRQQSAREAEEAKRAATLARTRGFGARGLSTEQGPDKLVKRKPVDILRSAIAQVQAEQSR